MNWLRKHSDLVNGWYEMIQMWRRHGVRDYVLTLMQSIRAEDLIWMLARAGVAYETGWSVPGAIWQGVNVAAPRVGVQWAFADLIAEELLKGGPTTIKQFHDVIDANYIEVNGQLEPRRAQ